MKCPKCGAPDTRLRLIILDGEPTWYCPLPCQHWWPACHKSVRASSRRALTMAANLIAQKDCGDRTCPGCAVQRAIKGARTAMLRAEGRLVAAEAIARRGAREA